MKVFLRAVCAISISIASFGVFADDIVIDQCPQGYTQAAVDITLAVSESENGCPLLEDKKFRKLVDKFEVGSIYDPSDPNSLCLSGVIIDGSTIWLKGENEPIPIEGVSQSAQRKFAEADAFGDGFTIAGTTFFGVPFLSGAATTIVSVNGDDLELDLVLTDRFTVNLVNGLDTEEFLVIGSAGDFKSVKGRLIGTAFSQIPYETFFEVTGNICVK